MWQSVDLLQCHELCTTPPKKNREQKYLAYKSPLHVSKHGEMFMLVMRKSKTINVPSDLHTSMQTDLKINTSWTSITHLEIKENHIKKKNDDMRWGWVSWNDILQAMITCINGDHGNVTTIAQVSDRCPHMPPHVHHPHSIFTCFYTVLYRSSLFCTILLCSTAVCTRVYIPTINMVIPCTLVPIFCNLTHPSLPYHHDPEPCPWSLIPAPKSLDPTPGSSHQLPHAYPSCSAIAFVPVGYAHCLSP